MIKTAFIAAVAAALFVGSVAVAAPGGPEKAFAPIPSATQALMSARDTQAGAPILMRAFKKEAELEVWKLARNGRYVLLKTFPICRWSGQLGPKLKTGDRQAPEGFYSVTSKQMNPNSAYHLSFDLGYPNAYDRAHGATGSFLMVHGICSSMGCYAMTDEQISEIYALAREAFAGGQRAFQFQSYPFRLTAANMARARSEPHIDFWRQLKVGYDRFEGSGEEPAVGVSGGRYSFAPYRNPEREAASQARIAAETEKTVALVADGVAAIRVTYQDGGMHATFVSLNRRGVPLGPVSRPEALAFAGKELVITPARVKPPLPPINVARMSDPAHAAAPADRNLVAMFARTPLAPGGMAAIVPVMTGSLAAIVPATFAPSKLDRLALRGA
ncbi:L,D-transpeptidase family protein [uncultured Enterovirga sp.]|uniref:L,D-transpeptidase family protein n=1 Tax=uncultured Enterovirga sp. TaxID=2026352 RepID=UPI0035CB9D7E